MLNLEKKGVSLILNTQSKLCERNAFLFCILLLYKKSLCFYALKKITASRSI